MKGINVSSKYKETIINLLSDENIISSIKKTIQTIKENSNNRTLNEDITFENIQNIFDLHYSLIDYINGDTLEVQELNKVKKEKNYLNKYITAFEQSIIYYKIINNEENINQMVLNILVLELFMKSTEDYYVLQSKVYSFFISSPDAIDAYKKLKRKRNPTKIEIQFIKKYEDYKYIKSILKMFRCYSLTKKNILTSLSISIYKAMMMTNEIKKHKVKEIIEEMFFNLDIPTTIRIKDIENVYIKTVVNNLVIYAYPSSKDIPSLYNFDEIDKILLNKMDKNKDNSSKLKKYENYKNTKLSPLRKKLDQ